MQNDQLYQVIYYEVHEIIKEELKEKLNLLKAAFLAKYEHLIEDLYQVYTNYQSSLSEPRYVNITKHLDKTIMSKRDFIDWTVSENIDELQRENDFSLKIINLRFMAHCINCYYIPDWENFADPAMRAIVVEECIHKVVSEYMEKLRPNEELL